MNRRLFLSRLLGAGAAGMALLGLPACNSLLTGEADEVNAQPPLTGTRVVAAGEGRLRISRDGGRTWPAGVNFGSQIRVREVRGSGPFYADLDFSGHPFSLKSLDGQTWYTLDYPLAGEKIA